MVPCPVCAESGTLSYADAGRVPIQCTALHHDRDEALAAPLGEMRLVLCPSCATVTNAAFDPTLVVYDGEYENSQLFSGTFRRYAEELAARLVREHDLIGAPVVEVGSGKGEFLAMLAAAGAGTATGYDPTYGGEIDHLEGRFDVRLIRSFFDRSTVVDPPSLVCARHVLEHVPDPVGMLTGLRGAVEANPACVLYVEVPDAAFTFSPPGLWDIIYQHCSYFSAVSLQWVGRAAGFDVAPPRSVFEGQFLSIEGWPTGPGGTPAGLPERVAETVSNLTDFGHRRSETVERWRDRLEGWDRRGDVVALWGGGAKGVTFLNLVGASIDAVVDVNDRKQGRFLPGTGHEVLAPTELPEVDPAVVVVMNGAYETEIRQMVRELGLDPEIAVV